ncbi:MAG: ParB/RepB/Spo0J family partition protein [Planctomycetota bacterium]
MREAVGAGGESTAIVVDHPSRNLKFEGVRRATGVHNIDLTRIIANKQHRETFDRQTLEQLADSLNSNGLVQPIVVRWDQSKKKYVIIAGERRFRAAQLSGWKEIKCDVKADDISDGEIAELQLTENISRKDLNPIEKAKAFTDVINKNGYTARDLAKKVGVNESTISRYVRLLYLSDDVQQKVASGIIPPSIAREAARLKGEAKQHEFIDKMMSGNFSTVDAHKVASGRKIKKRRTKRTAKSSTLFETDYGTVAIEFRQVEKPTYDHALEMLSQAIDEVELRIRNNINLKP